MQEVQEVQEVWEIQEVWKVREVWKVCKFWKEVREVLEVWKFNRSNLVKFLLRIMMATWGRVGSHSSACPAGQPAKMGLVAIPPTPRPCRPWIHRHCVSTEAKQSEKCILGNSSRKCYHILFGRWPFFCYVLEFFKRVLQNCWIFCKFWNRLGINSWSLCCTGCQAGQKTSQAKLS